MGHIFIITSQFFFITFPLSWKTNLVSYKVSQGEPIGMIQLSGEKELV